ncbi:MAG TPA: hypothetical protein VME46_22035 [Acidimicrobiales bacterium]|nr:hypothetical protein [Acidimicrobiales bacterium]
MMSSSAYDSKHAMAMTLTFHGARRCELSHMRAAYKAVHAAIGPLLAAIDVTLANPLRADHPKGAS